MHLYIQSLTCSLQVQAAALIKLLRILFFLPTIITFFLRTTCVWMLEQFTRSIMFDKCNMFTRLCSCKRARVSCTSAWFASMGAQWKCRLPLNLAHECSELMHLFLVCDAGQQTLSPSCLGAATDAAKAGATVIRSSQRSSAQHRSYATSSFASTDTYNCPEMPWCGHSKSQNSRRRATRPRIGLLNSARGVPMGCMQKRMHTLEFY